MSLCILAGGKVAVLAASTFTLAWTHSVEKIEWQEDWRVSPAGLEIIEARVKGSGAGMEPSEDAMLKDGWWVYAPRIKPVPELALASSGATVSGWTICTGGDCVSVGEAAGATIILKPCPEADQR
jgi:hypothetical protein